MEHGIPQPLELVDRVCSLVKVLVVSTYISASRSAARWLAAELKALDAGIPLLALELAQKLSSTHSLGTEPYIPCLLRGLSQEYMRHSLILFWVERE